MLFNSLGFAIFLPIVFILYWLFVKNLKARNFLLLGSSFFFYACWDYRFLFLLIFSITLDYFTGLKMSHTQNQIRRRFWFWVSIVINLGFLGAFKYYNFFIESFTDGLQLIGIDAHFSTLNIILPVGISFYTFHGLSYVIDIYFKRIEPERNYVDYAVFVSYFPLLVAGPIERATHLLPQIKRNRQFDYGKAIDGLRQILWGLFKKIVIADNCAKYADIIFNNPENHTGSTLILGAFLFAVQIYCDFSGYSDIALGTSRLFGIELLRNFAFPYFSRSIAEFWRRWHISLSTWFRDYVYIPLGGSRVGTWMKIGNTFVIFLISGFWHGANWTFIFWGFLNALFIIPSILSKTNRRHLDIVAEGKYLPKSHEFLSMLLTFCLTVFAWIFFRANSVGDAFVYISGIVSPSLFSFPDIWPYFLLLSIVMFFMIEWLGREEAYAIKGMGLKWPKFLRVSFYYCLVIAIFLFAGEQEQFIYFQF